MVFGSDGISCWQFTVYWFKKKKLFDLVPQQRKSKVEESGFRKIRKLGVPRNVSKFHKCPAAGCIPDSQGSALFVSVKRINQKQQLHLASPFDYNPLSFFEELSDFCNAQTIECNM